MENELNRLRLAVFAILGLACALNAALAADFPARPLTLIVPYTAGGAPDVLARVLGESATKNLGQPVIVDNRLGAGGNIGAQAVARAQPDGYTLLMCAFSCAVSPSLYTPVPFDIVKDFSPVAMLGTVPSVLVVNPKVPAQNLAGFLAYARANPGKLNAGSAGVGTSPHLAIELLRAKTGVVVTHVPYKGVAAVAADLLSGQVDMLFDNLPTSLQSIKSGRLRALAVASPKRSPAIPDVPTFAEAGVPDLLVIPWFGIMAPAHTPQAVVERLNQAVVAGLKTPSVVQRMEQLGTDVSPSTPQELGQFIVRERDKWKAVILANNIKAD